MMGLLGLLVLLLVILLVGMLVWEFAEWVSRGLSPDR